MKITQHGGVILPEPYAPLYDYMGKSIIERRKYLCRKQGWPVFLYKYKKFDEKILETYLIKSCLYLSSNSQFNDPYDSKSFLVFPNVGAYRNEYLNHLHKIGNGTYKTRKELAKRLSSPEKIQDELNRVRDNIVQKTGIHSFSKTPRNLLMWSHYASVHEGLCLIFNTPMDMDVFVTALPVTYDKNFPIVNHQIFNSKELINKTFLTKPKDWHYENEYRIMVPDSANKKLAFNPKALFGIILGERFTKENEGKLIKLLNIRKDKGFEPIQLFKAKLSKAEYKIKFYKI